MRPEKAKITVAKPSSNGTIAVNTRDGVSSRQAPPSAAPVIETTMRVMKVAVERRQLRAVGERGEENAGHQRHQHGHGRRLRRYAGGDSAG